MKIALITRHNLANPLHELVLLLDIKWLENESKADLTLSTLLLTLDELNHGLVDIWERFKDDGFHRETSAFL